MSLSKKKLFFTILFAFLLLGIPFKVMILVEGFTEVRPVNAIPPVAGLCGGLVGALACGIGNVIADVFGTFNASSLLGLIANFIAAYLPYRLWHIFSTEAPNLHKVKNIVLYILINLISAMTVSWILAFGLNYFFDTWIEVIYTYSFFNNLGFSIILGMPLFVMLTSDEVNIICEKRPTRFLLFERISKGKYLLTAMYMLLMAVLCISVIGFHIVPSEHLWTGILSMLSLAGLTLYLL